jgi:poly(A) polymerase
MSRLLTIKNLSKQLKLNAYLVGGVLRDCLLNRKVDDFDLVVDKEVKKLARRFARRVGGSFVVLDADRDIYRVIKVKEIYDFTPLRGQSIKKDLLNRDFTINALALPLEAVREEGLHKSEIKDNLIDPTGGQQDLEQKKIKAVSNKAFTDDSLRLFRAVRFKAQLRFTITKNTEELMQRAGKRIEDTAEERIKEELLKILAAQDAAANLAYLESKFSLLSTLLPAVNQMKQRGQCAHHREDIWTHSVYAVEKVEQLLKDDFWKDKIALDDRLPLLKLGVLFHDIGKLITEEAVDGEIHFYDHHREGADYIVPMLKRLTFSNQQLNYIKTLIRYHMRPFFLYSADNLTSKGKHRFFREVEESTADVCLTAGADMLSTVELNGRSEGADEGIEFLKELIRDRKVEKERTRKRLVTGEDVMEIFSIPEGPKVGRILKQVKAAQAAGEVSTYQEAIDYIEEILEGQK